MKSFSIFDEPLKVYGLPLFNENHLVERFPEELRNSISEDIKFFGRRCPGARVEFRTNSKRFKVKIIFETLSFDIGMSVFSCQSAYVYVGSHSTSKYLGHVYPRGCYVQKEAEGEFFKSDKTEDVQIFFPRNEIMKNIIVEVEDDSIVEAPTPYKYSKPVIFYGSSITEGGCCSKISNAYSSIISRRLDMDFYNFGLSGSCKGELPIADFFNKIEKSIFVLDYEHNAPNVEYLKSTHEPFFKRLREASPDLPIIIVSKPVFEEKEHDEGWHVLHTTYENAVARGDKNVYFIDGNKFFPPENGVYCTNDLTHPNDLGMFYMANAIEPTVKMILESQK